MFTGLIECRGEVLKIERRANSQRILIAPEPEDFTLKTGESVTVDGLCLTVAGFQARAFWVEVSSESLARSTLGELRKGSRVNLERALRMGDRLGGHLVQGHVDGVGKIIELRKEGEFKELRIQAPREIMRYIVEKGSVAVDGISLTVNKTGSAEFRLMLIPETLTRTTLGEKKMGDSVNLEADLIGKYVERLLFDRKSRGSGEEALDKITWDKLKDEGFL
jgi:riboflavin synthase